MQRSAGIGRRSSASARSGRQQRGASVSRRSSASAMSRHSKHVPNLTAGGPAQPQHLRLRVVWLQKRGREGGEIA